METSVYDEPHIQVSHIHTGNLIAHGGVRLKILAFVAKRVLHKFSQYQRVVNQDLLFYYKSTPPGADLTVILD